MFDNLRDDATSSYESEAKFQPAASTVTSAPPPRSKRILGMTSFQRFIVTFMLMIAVCVIGAMALLVTGKIAF